MQKPSILKSKLFLSALSGLLLGLSWPTYGFPFLIFFAMVPLFMIEDEIKKTAKKPLSKVFLYTYFALIIWNTITTWWIWNSTDFGAIMAIVLNSLFMSLIWVLFSFSKRYFTHSSHAIFILPVYWVAFEYLHLDWDLSWSWLNLGNVFADYPSAIQWYEYTGTLGGTWWILIVNILVFKLVQKMMSVEFSSKRLVFASIPMLLFIFIPLIYSWQVYVNYEEKGENVEVVVVQPNMDPWSEQFTSPPEEVIKRIIDLSSPLISENTKFLLAPESAIQEGLRESGIFNKKAQSQGVSLDLLQEFLQKHPNLQLIIGASTYQFLDEATPTSRTTKGGSIYDEYNTAILMNAQGAEEVYHKSKLVPGPEKMPFKKILQPLQEIAFDLGGTVGSLGSDSERKVFYSKDKKTGGAPLICYESIYGGFVAEFVRNRAQLLFIITNDGWWGDTQGHKQHLAFASLRAIECRRSIARSANTGISCFVNQRGDLLETTSYWTPDARKANIKAQKELTFFVRYGDYPGRVSAFLAALLLLISVSVFLKKDRADENNISEFKNHKD